MVKPGLRSAVTLCPFPSPSRSREGNTNATGILWHWYRTHIGELEKMHPLLFERIITAIVPICGMEYADGVKSFFTGYLESHEEVRDAMELSNERMEIN